MWLRGDKTKPEKESKDVGFVNKARKTTKEIQSTSTFTVPGPFPKALQDCGSLAKTEHESPNSLSA